MDLREFRPLYTDVPGPRLTACLDVSRDNENGAEEVALRWRALRDQMDGKLPAEILDAAGERLVQETGTGGPCERAVVVGPDGVELERLLPGHAHSSAHCGPLPRLTHVVTAEDARVDYVLVEIDRTGADITVNAQDRDWSLLIEGQERPIRKVSAGGWSQLHWEHRAENTWEHNAVTTAAALDRVVDGTGVEVVAVAGDVRAAALLKDAVSDAVRERMHILDGGGRGENQPAGRLPDELTSVLEARATERAREAVDRLGEAGGHGLAASGLADVVAALRRAQVDTLLIPPDWADETQIWYGPDLLALGLVKKDLQALGVDDPLEGAACDVVLRAATGADSKVVVTPPHVADLKGAPAAILRFTDPSTN